MDGKHPQVIKEISPVTWSSTQNINISIAMSKTENVQNSVDQGSFIGS